MDENGIIIINDDLSESSDNEKEKFEKNNSDNLDAINSENSNSSDFEFPSVHFDHISKKSNLSLNKEEEKCNSDSESHEVDDVNINKVKRRNVEDEEQSDSDSFKSSSKHNLELKTIRTASQSDSDYETQSSHLDFWIQNLEKYQTEDKGRINLSSDEDDVLVAGKLENNKEKKNNKTNKSKKAKDEEKKRRQEERMQEKAKKQEDLAKQKAIKQLNSKNRLNNNPEYNMKLMEVILDDQFQNSDFYIDFLKLAKETDIKFNVQSQLIPKSITWNRKVEENYLNEKHEVCSNMKIVNENHIMIIRDCEEIVQLISDNIFVSFISEIQSLVPDKKILIVIYKIENYFKYLKMQKESTNSSGGTKQKKPKTVKHFSDLPKISRKTFEELLVEIQLMYNVNSRLIENQNEMALLIHQYTKSLALLPLKKEKKQQESSQIDWCIDNDNRDTVKVDKDGNGLKRFWQQQLCQFTLMSLETAEAISSVYKSPLELMDAYASVSTAEGELLLKDIPIRRAAGPLTTVRKIGPELSKKLFVMFTSENGEAYLN